jgi:glycosyltransferase involved in cell wall biosynthesis
MKVLLVLERLWPLLGGLQRHVYSLARYLSNVGHEVSILTSNGHSCFQPGGFPKEVRIFPTLKVLRKNVPGFKTLWDSKNVAYTARRFCEEFDIIHYHTGNFLFPTTSRKPAVQTLHFHAACILGDRVTNPCHKPSCLRCTVCHINRKLVHAPIGPLVALYCSLYYRLARWSLIRCSKVICQSDYVKRAVIDAFELSNVIKIPNFIDINGEIESAMDPNFKAEGYLGVPEDANIVTFFGRLVHEKGLDTLIGALKLVLKNYSDKVYVIIGGDGPQKPQLEKMAKSVGNIIFIGVPSRNIQFNLMAQSDIFIYPSRAPESCSASILEAMALGLPIIATGIDWNSELIEENKGGFLIRPNSPRGMANRIERILKDEEFKLRAGEYNKRKSKKFDLRTIGPQIVDVYEEAVHMR